jgi:hypothetical protein
MTSLPAASGPRARLLVLCVLVLALSIVTPAAATTLTLGSPELNYAILYEGNGGHHVAINNFGTTGIWNGNIGIGGTGTLAATGPGTLNGFVDFSAANTGQASISNTTLNPSSGNPRYNVADVTTALTHINDYSGTLAAKQA